MPDVFDRLDEIAGALPAERWVLVGGLMVHVHAQLAGIRYARPTDDADIVVELRAGSYSDAVATLATLGYLRHEPLDERAPLHRFTRRGTAIVDLMAPEGRTVRFGGRAVLSVPGSRSALNRTITYATPGGETLRVPDLESALSLKGAAFHTSSANRQRHLQDTVSLLACANGGTLDLSKSMRSNINNALNALHDPEAWGFADPMTRRRALRTALALRPDWVVPEFVLPRRPRP